MKSAILADEYRARALAESNAASASPLDQVRAKHARAAAIWTGLADAEDLRGRLHSSRDAARLSGGATSSAPSPTGNGLDLAS